MSFTTFQAVHWDTKLMRQLRAQQVYSGLCNRDYEGEATRNGSVRINSINDVTIFNVQRNTDITAPEVLSFVDQDLKITEAKGYNFLVDNIDKRQAAGDFMPAAMETTAFGLAKAADNFLSALMQTDAGLTVTAATIGIGAGEFAIYDVIVEMGVALDETSTPDDGRWVVVPPFAAGLLRLDERFVGFGTDASRAVLRGAPIGMVDNFTVYRSNQVPTSGVAYSVLAGHKMATTYASAIDESEAYSPERRIKTDAVKGEHVYGAAVIRPEQLVRCDVTRGALRAA